PSPIHTSVVLWHGMGDSCCNAKSLGRFMNMVEEELPGVYIHSVNLAGDDGDESTDRKASFFGDANAQVDEVCTSLRKNPMLTGGFNAIGFSQGGQFLRAYIERCNDPPVRNLITFGAQHAGVADIPNCLDRGDIWCLMMRRMVRTGVYSNWAQHNIIQAQYYKDPRRIELYLNQNSFLADINNENQVKNVTYAKHLASLDAFVMVKFENDQLVIPKETSWFGYIEKDQLVDLRSTQMYREDWLGLQALDQRDALIFEACPTEHMNIPKSYFTSVILPYLSKPVPSKPFPSAETRMRQHSLSL
ncbi:MAG: palmitoyl protein thioesterase, partial [Piptocephalis tieghemiana]